MALYFHLSTRRYHTIFNNEVQNVTFNQQYKKKETEVSPRLTNFVLQYVLSINLAANKTTFALQAYSPLNYNRQWLGILLP